jgi:hypothetical protein
MRRSETAVASADALRLRWLTVVVAIMAALTVGWQVLNITVPNRRTLVAGTMLQLGPSQGDLARITVGPGWSMVPSATDPRLDYSLRRGSVDLTISYVHIFDDAPTAQLWAGLRQVIQVINPGVGLGSPSPFMTAQGRRGDQGALVSRQDIGSAAVIRDRSGTFAVEAILIAPRRTSRANVFAAHRVIRSLEMPARRR